MNKRFVANVMYRIVQIVILLGLNAINALMTLFFKIIYVKPNVKKVILRMQKKFVKNAV